ncbi:hypothetical protein DAH92_22090, partial [Sphingomonas koreensis]|uniref:hypothetical protein n=1 Tax=Sphingomonas koreensis TaxID=93064 RepID=UPI000F7F03FE
MSIFAKPKPKQGGASMTRARAGQQVTTRLEANPAIRKAKIDAAQIYYYPGFLNDAECDTLIRLIDANRRPSTLLAASEDPEFRTSESCDLDRWSPDVRPLDERMANLLGVPPEHGETMQGQRYAPGQQFRPHYDWFSENQEYWTAMKASGGQRVRRQNIRHNSRRRLAECGPRQGVDVRRRTCGAASADVRWSVA